MIERVLCYNQCVIEMLRNISRKLFSIVCVEMCVLVATSVPVSATEPVGVRMTSVDMRADYLFARGEVFGSATNRASIVDTFVTTNLLDQWNWIDANRLGAGTNATAVLIVPQTLAMTNMPGQLFVKMSERIAENGDMHDRDSDGSPNVYEINNDTNPYVADFEDAPKITVPTDCEYAAFTNALWSSAPYSIIEIGGEMYFDDSIDMPGWPLLITGPANGYAVIHSSADIGVFMVNRRQTDHTLLRNIYLTMDKKSSFQAGFWIGGNLPWSTDAAGASFENVRLRMYNPGTWYYGWHMYGITDTPVVISNCTISAAGATDVIPVYVYGDSQVVVTNGLDLINMPNTLAHDDYTWSGYSQSLEYSHSKDSDNDGVCDYDEVHLYGTDLWLRDTDGDRIDDAVEIAHGADPTNQLAYCYELTVLLTNHNTGIVRYNLGLYDSIMSNRVSQIYEATNYVSSVKLHYNHAFGERPKLHVWSADEGAFVHVPYSVSGHDMSVLVLESQLRPLYDRDDDGMPDEWEVVNGLCPTNAADAVADLDGDGLLNVYEYWAGTNCQGPDGTNTLPLACSSSIDLRVSGRSVDNSIRKFTNYAGGESVLNTNFWLSGADSSCASFWNDFPWPGTFRKAGTLISEKHALFAAHFPPAIGGNLLFMDSSGNVCTNTVVATNRIGQTDILVALLQKTMADISVAKILPKDYQRYLGSGVRLPVVQFDYEEKAVVAELSQPLGSYAHTRRPLNSIREAFFENTYVGDSGNPIFLLINDELVLLGATHTGGGYVSEGVYDGVGAPFVTYYAEQIQAAMDNLEPGYSLQYIDLSGYPVLPYLPGDQQ